MFILIQYSLILYIYIVFIQLYLFYTAETGSKIYFVLTVYNGFNHSKSKFNSYKAIHYIELVI
jgi:hypothetical protein